MENNGLRNDAHLFGLELSVPKLTPICETEPTKNSNSEQKSINQQKFNSYENKNVENYGSVGISENINVTLPSMSMSRAHTTNQLPTVNEVVDCFYNGNLFTGTLVNGLPEGQGIIVYTKTNNTFEGLFREGKIADQPNGKFTQKKGNNIIVYTGAFKNNNPCGRGKLEFMNKYIYEGDIVNNKKHGKGKITYLTDGTVYEGDFVNDKKHGKGKLSNYKNGFVYEGNFVDDKKHGKGKYINFNNNTVYEGDFDNDKKHGKGKFINYNDNSVYEGDFVNDRKNGKGKTIKYNDNSVYEGDFIDDQIIQNDNFQKYSVTKKNTPELQKNTNQQPENKNIINAPPVNRNIIYEQLLNQNIINQQPVNQNIIKQERVKKQINQPTNVKDNLNNPFFYPNYVPQPTDNILPPKLQITREKRGIFHKLLFKNKLNPSQADDINQQQNI